MVCYDLLIVLVCVILCAPKYDLFGFALVCYFVVFIAVYSCGGVTGLVAERFVGVYVVLLVFGCFGCGLALLLVIWVRDW